MKKRILSALLTIALLLQVFTFTAFAAEISAVVTLDNETRTVTVSVENLNANANFSLMAKYDGAIDYLNQYKADAEGKAVVTYPSSKEWERGKVISVQINGKVFEATVDIPVLATSIKVDGSSLVTVKKGKTVTLTATVGPEDATNKVVEWISSDTSIVEIDSNGVVTAKATGMIMITAKTTDGTELTNKITVRVTP